MVCKQYLDKIMQGYDYILGFPVAGGCIKIKKEELATKAELDCCLFDHFMIESKIRQPYQIMRLFLIYLSSLTSNLKSLMTCWNGYGYTWLSTLQLSLS